MKHIKYIQGEKRSKWTNKQSIPDTSSCLSSSLAYVLAACRVACCPLPACSASPFATLSAARIGYVECPFNGLNTHTQSLERILLQTFQSLHSCSAPFDCHELLPHDFHPFSAFSLRLFCFLLCRHRHVIISLRVLPGNYGTLCPASAAADQFPS